MLTELIKQFEDCRTARDEAKKKVEEIQTSLSGATESLNLHQASMEKVYSQLEKELHDTINVIKIDRLGE